MKRIRDNQMDLKAIYHPIQDEIFLVEKEIENQIALITASQNFRDREFIGEVVSYLFEVPGKMLRPALVLLAAKAVDELSQASRDDVVKLAAAVEFVHTASLIHDDIIDGSNYRRHRITLNRQFGNKVAVMVGDILYSQFFSLLIGLRAESGRREQILRVFCETTKKLCFGEICEHKIRELGSGSSFHDYLKVVENKTASLFSASCLGGCLLNGADDGVSEALALYGLYLGFVFQIIDDFIDEDAIYRSGSNLVVKAAEFAEMAKAVISGVRESTAQRTLANLLDYVMEKAEMKNR